MIEQWAYLVSASTSDGFTLSGNVNVDNRMMPRRTFVYAFFCSADGSPRWTVNINGIWLSRLEVCNQLCAFATYMFALPRLFLLNIVRQNQQWLYYREEYPYRFDWSFGNGAMNRGAHRRQLFHRTSPYSIAEHIGRDRRLSRRTPRSCGHHWQTTSRKLRTISITV